MKNTLFSFILIGFIVLTVACNNSKNSEQEANIQLAEIANLIQHNEFNQAKLLIDTFHVQFRNLVTQRKQVVALNDTIILRESARTLAYCKANLPLMQSELKELQQKFEFIKNEKYEEFGKYILKSQRDLLLIGKTALQCEVGEKGDLEITSLYTGTGINHKSIVLTAQSGTFETEESQAVLHAFKNEQQVIEQLTFNTATSDSLANFVSENENMAIKVQLKGNNLKNYMLDNHMISALKTSYKLSRAIKQVRETENAQRIAMQRIGKINLLYKQ